MTKYKVGDIVTIKSEEWYNSNKNGCGNISGEKVGFVSHMAEYCGKQSRITEVRRDGTYCLEIDSGQWAWEDYMFEEESITIDISSLYAKMVEQDLHFIRPLPGKLVCVADSYHEDGPREDWTIARFVKIRAKGISTENGIWNYCIPAPMFNYNDWEYTKKYIYRGENHELIRVNKDE